MLEECTSYIEACIYNVKNKKVMTSQETQGKIGFSERLRKQKYECKSHIQLCALFSQLGQHETALAHGKTAVKKTEQFMNDCLMICTDHLSRHRQKSLKFGPKKLLEKPSYLKFHELVTKGVPIIEYILNKLKNKRVRNTKAPKLDMRTVLGVQRHNDWIYNYNIGDMMLIVPMTLYELKNTINIQAELTRDLMLEKILMVVVAHFCVATEIRFLTSNNSKIQVQEAKIWHKKALEFGQPFLPTSCPLFLHISNSYIRNYSENLSETSKNQEKKIKKYKNKTPNPELKRPRSTSAPKVKPKDDKSIAVPPKKKKFSPRIGDRTPPARTVTKDLQFNFNSPTIEKINNKPKPLNSFQVKKDESQSKLKRPVSNSTESDIDQEIVISSYDLYGTNSGDASDVSDESQIDSTGGKQEPIIISATGGNSCLFKS